MTVWHVLWKKVCPSGKSGRHRERILQIRRFADNPWVRAGITQKFDRSIFKKAAGGSFLYEIQIVSGIVSAAENERTKEKLKGAGRKCRI